MSESIAGIIYNNGKYLLGKRKIGGSIGGKWEFPGGKVENGETYKNALKREFLEELGVDIIVKDFIIKTVFKCDTHCFTLHAYYIDLLDENIKKYEHDEFQYFSLEEIKMMENLADSDKLLLEYLV